MQRAALRACLARKFLSLSPMDYLTHQELSAGEIREAYRLCSCLWAFVS